MTAAGDATENAPTRPSFVGAFVAPALVAVLVVTAWVTKPEPDPPLGQVADFALLDQNGRKVTRGELDGHPWIADFVFTRCGGPCPRLSEGMEWLQSKLGRSDARLVSFSVDPDHDTPAVLQEYARAHQAEDRWSFLTGDVAAVSSLLVDSFHLPMMRNPDAPVASLVTHSTRLVLVDRHGMIRGYFEGVDQNGQVNVDGDRGLVVLLRELRMQGSGSRLPLVDAALNATSAVLLVLGFAFIRARRVRAHAFCMLSALFVSAVFLGCYVSYHSLYPETPFAGHGAWRFGYFLLLISHVILAVPVAPLAVATAVLGLKGRVETHARLASATFPIWLYVSATGVAVYALLHEIFKP